jgi:hypothetical protein
MVVKVRPESIVVIGGALRPAASNERISHSFFLGALDDSIALTFMAQSAQRPAPLDFSRCRSWQPSSFDQCFGCPEPCSRRTLGRGGERLVV